MGKHIMKVPDVGEGVVEIEIVEWLVEPGDTINEDQHIVDVMTDKATVEITSPVPGKVLSTSGAPGDMLAVGADMIVFEIAGDSPDLDSADTEIPVGTSESPAAKATAVNDAGPVAVSATTPADESEDVVADKDSSDTISESIPVKKEPAAISSAEVTADHETLASPAVRRRAREANINLSLVSGTGRGNRITHDDINRYIESGQVASGSQAIKKRTGTTEIKVIGLRRVIAEKMATSKQHIPHFSYVEELDVTEMESLRQHLNANRNDDQPKLTYLPFIMQAISRLMVDHPECNAHFDDEAGIVTRFSPVHIGIATQTSKGLMVPVVKHAESQDIWQLANQVTLVSEGAKNNTIAMELLSGSTITITSLGPLGGIVSTPVINYPEVAIIGVNKSIERPVIRNGQVTSRLMMNLSSSFDHRVVDGYNGALFIQALKTMLEHPATIFM
jgi:2-oxoisovalerate dehydrogenase E2 component (dihydrolipoyl transacylase)